MIYWEWHLIPRCLLRSIFARIPEQLLNGLVSWQSPGESSKIDCYLGELSGFCPSRFGVLICSSAADTYLKLLERVVSGASSLTEGVFESDIVHRRSVKVLWILYNISSNPMHPLFGAVPGKYVPLRVTRGALIAHLYTRAPPRRSSSQDFYSFVGISLWNDLGNPVFDGIGLASFKSRANAVLLA